MAQMVKNKVSSGGVIILAPLLLLGVYRQSRIAPPGEAVPVQGPVPD